MTSPGPVGLVLQRHKNLEYIYPLSNILNLSKVQDRNIGTIDFDTVGSPVAEAMYLQFFFKSEEHQSRFMESKTDETIK
jgi:hypothetical protein